MPNEEIISKKILRSIPEGFRAFNGQTGKELKVGDEFISFKLELINQMKPKLSPYQERLARLRVENLLSESEIAKLMGKKPQTIRLQFMEIRKILEIPTFEEAYRQYKKIQAAPIYQHVESQQIQTNQSLAD